MTGLVIKGIGGFYTVMDAQGCAYQLRAQAKLRKQKVTPMVGDRVVFEPGQGEEDGWLKEILPRTNFLTRPPVSNIDVVAVVLASASPNPDLQLIDRILLGASLHRIPAMLIINKSDEAPEEAAGIARQYGDAGLEGIYLTCATTGEGIDRVRAALAGKTHAFAGQSGVGKSTLINAMYGFELKTGGLSEKIDRGKHTTRHSELIPLKEGGMVLDTPGFSLLTLPTMEPHGLSALYPEFAPYEPDCRFSPCAHIKEPGCAVTEAVASGLIDEKRYARYVEYYREMDEKWRERYG